MNQQAIVAHSTRKFTPSEAIPVEKEAWISAVDHYLANYPVALSNVRRRKVRHTILRFAKEIKKHPLKVERSDLERFFQQLKDEGKKPWTQNNYKIILKAFYRKKRGKNFVGWIHIPKNLKPSIGPEDVISSDELARMVNASEGLRDKALISSLFEGDFRPGEFLGLRIRNVKFDQYGARIHIEHGKTGPRNVRIISSAPYLANWIENHPVKKADSPLWVSLSNNGRNDALKGKGLRDTVKRIAKQAHVEKRIWPYLFRHSRNTELASSLTEAPFCEYAGWQIGSRMPSFYVHLSGKNVDDAILKSYGIMKDDDEKKMKLPKTCLRCGLVNSPEQDLCTKCGLALSLKAAMAADEDKRKLEERVSKLEEDVMKDREARRIRHEDLKKQLEGLMGRS